MAQYSQLNELIAALRAATAPASITPESHGYILKKIADILTTLVTATELQSTVQSINRDINTVQNNHNQDYANIQDLLDDKAGINGNKNNMFYASQICIGKDDEDTGPYLNLAKKKTNYGDSIDCEWLRIRNTNKTGTNLLYETYVPIPKVGSSPTQYILATRKWVEDKINNANLTPGSAVDLTGYYTSEEIDNLLENFATQIQMAQAISGISFEPDLSAYYTAEYCNEHFMQIEDAYSKQEINDFLDDKQDEMTFDDEPTAASTNPVTSAGIRRALLDKQDKFEIVELTKVNGEYSTDLTFNQVKTMLENGKQVLYHYNKLYYVVSSYENSDEIFAFSVIGEIVKTLLHQPTRIDVQSIKIGNSLDLELEEKYQMINCSKNLLDSMGDTIDNIGNTSGTAMHFIPSTGNFYFDPTLGIIAKKLDDGYLNVGEPDRNMIYGNKANNKLFKWTGTTFVELS